MKMSEDILSLNMSELKESNALKEEPKFRAQQIFDWLHNKRVSSFSDMKNVPQKLQNRLREEFRFGGVSLHRKLVSKKDGTVKYVFSLWDGEFVETVLLKSQRGLSVCVSTQAGCKMGCAFCASTKAGFSRNLSAGEILSQIYFASGDAGERVSSVVLMGIGEPLDNYDNVLRFLELISAPEGMNLSHRHISLSTCGVVPGIERLREEDLQITLSVSLHAPFDQMRSEMMPINKVYPISVLMKACDDYFESTKRRISFEYAVIKGKNDTDACADKLRELLKGKNCHINLIPVNEIKEKPFESGSSKVAADFAQKLTKRGLNATVRRRLGEDIDAACGQLRRETKESERKEPRNESIRTDR